MVVAVAARAVSGRVGRRRMDDARKGHGHTVPGRGHIGNATVYDGLLGHLEQVQVWIVGTMGPGNKVVLVAEEPLLVTTIHRVDVDQMTRVLLEVLLEGAKLELHGGVGKVQQTIGHINVIEGARQGHNGWIVAKVYGDTLGMSRRWSTRCIMLLMGMLLFQQETTRVGSRVIGCVSRMVGPNTKRSAMN